MRACSTVHALLDVLAGGARSGTNPNIRGGCAVPKSREALDGSASDISEAIVTFSVIFTQSPTHTSMQVITIQRPNEVQDGDLNPGGKEKVDLVVGKMSIVKVNELFEEMQFTRVVIHFDCGQSFCKSDQLLIFVHLIHHALNSDMVDSTIVKALFTDCHMQIRLGDCFSVGVVRSTLTSYSGHLNFPGYLNLNPARQT